MSETRGVRRVLGFIKPAGCKTHSVSVRRPGGVQILVGRVKNTLSKRRARLTPIIVLDRMQNRQTREPQTCTLYFFGVRFFVYAPGRRALRLNTIVYFDSVQWGLIHTRSSYRSGTLTTHVRLLSRRSIFGAKQERAQYAQYEQERRRFGIAYVWRNPSWSGMYNELIFFMTLIIGLIDTSENIFWLTQPCPHRWPKAINWRTVNAKRRDVRFTVEQIILLYELHNVTTTARKGAFASPRSLPVLSPNAYLFLIDI